MLPKIKALLEGGQRLYTKNATTQRIVLIQRRYGYLTLTLNFNHFLDFCLYRYLLIVYQNQMLTMSNLVLVINTPI